MRAGAIAQRLVLPRRGWRAALLAYLAGALMTLGFAPYHAWPVVFISLPLFYQLLMTRERRAQALWCGFFFGYGYFMAGTWWIGNALLVDAAKFGWMLPFSILGLSAVLALYFLPLAYASYRLRTHMTPLLFAALWVGVEYLRSVGAFGFPWNLAGYIGLASLPFAQLAAWVGTFGLGFVIVAVGLLPVLWLGEGSKRRALMWTVLGVALVLGECLWGAARLRPATAMTATTLRLVQPNIPQEVKGTREGQQLAIEVLGRLTRERVTAAAPDAVIWPETAYPFTLRATNGNPTPHVPLLLTGATRVEGVKPGLAIWNSLVALGGDGTVRAQYDKHQLVPFGEFVPLRAVLPLEKITPGDIDFSRGVGAQTLTVANVPPFSPLVCYEVIFPWLAVDPSARPDWLLNVTNDGWYGDSPGPYQHFDMSRMRAIEQGLPLVRVANSGISAVIDGRGVVMAAMSLNHRGVLDLHLPQQQGITGYVRYGEEAVLVFLCALFFIHFLGISLIKNK